MGWSDSLGDPAGRVSEAVILMMTVFQVVEESVYLETVSDW